MRNLLLLFSALILASCGTRKNTPPSWISGKPIDATGTYVYGIGSSYINPNTAYQQAARSNALADLAQEVQSEIYEETKLLQKEAELKSKPFEPHPLFADFVRAAKDTSRLV